MLSFPLLLLLLLGIILTSLPPSTWYKLPKCVNFGTLLVTNLSIVYSLQLLLASSFTAHFNLLSLSVPLAPFFALSLSIFYFFALVYQLVESGFLLCLSCFCCSLCWAQLKIFLFGFSLFSGKFGLFIFFCVFLKVFSVL